MTLESQLRRELEHQKWIKEELELGRQKFNKASYESIEAETRNLMLLVEEFKISVERVEKLKELLNP